MMATINTTDKRANYAFNNKRNNNRIELNLITIYQNNKSNNQFNE